MNRRKININSVPKKMSVRYQNKDLYLPDELKKELDHYWANLIKSGKKFTRGNVYAIKDIVMNSEKLNIHLEKTDYAHYLYSREFPLSEENVCKEIHSAAMIKTSDEKMFFGEMSPNTAHPNRLQFVGGGIDLSDIKGGLVDFKHSLVREAKEEVGLDLLDETITETIFPKYIKTGGLYHVIAIIYEVKLKIDSQKFEELYNDFIDLLKEAGEEPEFVNLHSVSVNLESINDFFNNEKRAMVDYIEPVFREEVDNK
ncbi:NUDIX hydrolase [Chengkuizengella axinellae]|uniref:NUDIX hydrolase n=1 Tax=Chengkuizengella axinellae TaxID=3064388 RepID=A0ABT9J326_9BACL|nr:NUDIX hydrolase [Chengkuizengella sp. 2205SS18-9]MDP5276025.1 NUDIX hydrolase [Chengkuizengella sp. 2205SS18-9]